MNAHLGIDFVHTRRRVGWESYWREGFRHPGALTPNAEEGPATAESAGPSNKSSVNDRGIQSHS